MGNSHLSKNSIFEYEVKDLQAISANAYQKLGILCNPFYYFNNCKKEIVHEINHRKATIRELTNLLFSKKYLYASGDLIGGSGKSYLASKIFNRLSKDKNHFVILLKDLVRYRYPLSSIYLAINFIEENYFKKNKLNYTSSCIALLDEVEFNEIYTYFIDKNCLIIGFGHYKKRDIGNNSKMFYEINIDKKYPITLGETKEHIIYLLRRVNAENILSKAQIDFILSNTPTIGIAEAVIGALLSLYVKRHLEGQNTLLAWKDVTFWVNIIGTNWFWYSMDCWRVTNPVTVKIKIGNHGKIESVLLEIEVHSEIRNCKIIPE